METPIYIAQGDQISYRWPTSLYWELCLDVQDEQIHISSEQNA